VPVSAWRMEGPQRGSPIEVEGLLNQTEPLGKDDIFERWELVVSQGTFDACWISSRF
jgi:hypothetical protein